MKSSRALWRVAVPVIWLLGVAGVAAIQLQGVASPVAPGVAEPATIVVPSPRVAHVASLHVKLGEWVAPDQLLARLESPSLDEEIEIAEAELAQLEHEIRATSVDLSDDLRRATARMSDQAEDSALQVARLRSTLQAGMAELKGARAQYKRQADLFAQKLIPGSAVEELAGTVRILEARVASDRSALEQARVNAKAGASRVEAEGTVEQSGQLAPHRLAVQVQRNRLEALIQARRRLNLRAPVSGLISEILLRPGAVAGENLPVFVIVDPAPTTLIAYADEVWAAQVHIGDHARATPSDGRGVVQTGVVVALAPRIAELPLRFSPVPGQPSFGRAIYVALDAKAGAGPLPGQAFDVVFHGAEP